MPYVPRKRLYRRRRPAARRPRRAARRSYRPRVSRRPLGLTRQGYLHCKRRVPTFTIHDTNTEGGLQTTDPNSITFGLSELVAGTQHVYDVPFTMKFQLNQVANDVEFIQLFQFYRIKNVMIKLCYNGASTFVGGQPVPQVQYISDHNDNVMPAAAAWNQKMGVKTKTFTGTNQVWMGVNPVPNAVIQSQPTEPDPIYTPSALMRRAPWIDTAFDDVMHFGIKGYLQNLYLPAGQSINSTAIRVEIWYDLEFKGVE